MHMCTYINWPHNSSPDIASRGVLIIRLAQPTLAVLLNINIGDNTTDILQLILSLQVMGITR